MPLFSFHLHKPDTVIQGEPIEFASRERAVSEAVETARELMRNRESKTRSWRLQVVDEQQATCFNVLFASIDETLSVLEPRLRAQIEAHTRVTASLAETIRDVRRNIQQLRGTMAQVDRKPYLAAVDGVALRG